VTVRAGVEHTTLWLKEIDSTKAPSRPNNVLSYKDERELYWAMSVHADTREIVSLTGYKQIAVSLYNI